MLIKRIARTKSDALADTNEHSTRDEDADSMPWRECLHESSYDDHDRACSHADFAASPISHRAAYEETPKDSSYGISCIDGSGKLKSLVQVNGSINLVRGIWRTGVSNQAIQFDDP